jgi:uncharacterized protein YdaU (DUF1376 family)
MHYYQFHIGDYKSHTHHLSLIEDLAYRRLLDHYYLHESPIKQRDIARQIGMRDHEQEVLTVLDEFFISAEDGFIHPRADVEINKFKEFAEAGKRGAAKRWLKGGDREATSPPNAPPIATINHKPRTINQEPVIDAAPKGSAKAKRLSGDWVLPKEWGLWTVDNMKWDSATVRFEADKFKDFWMAKAGRDAAKADWYATWRNWCRNSKTEAKPTVSNFAGGI